MGWVQEGAEISVAFYDGVPAQIKLPVHVDVEVVVRPRPPPPYRNQEHSAE